MSVSAIWISPTGIVTTTPRLHIPTSQIPELRGQGRQRRWRRRSWRICSTTLRPGMPVTPPPPWVADDAWYSPLRSACGSRRSRARAACGTAALGDSSPWKMLPPSSPYVVLHVVRADHLAVQDRVVKPGATLSTWAIDAVGVRVELVVVRLVGPLVRHPLREHRHHVLALGRERRSNTDGMQMSANGRRGGPAGDRVLERVLDVVERRREHDRAAVHVGVEARRGGELGQPVEREVHLDRAAAASSTAACRRRSRRAARRGRAAAGT